ncbi:MAG: ROK family protein [Cyclobacteriaceae bacterium]|nr:ROK family protein [Cyclobacteriaceae bacterium]
MAVLGIDLGATKISYALFDDLGTFLYRGKKMLDRADLHSAEDLLLNMVTEMLAKGDKLRSPVKAIGICVPGIAYKDTGMVWAPNIQGWDNFPLVAHLRKKIIKTDIPIEIESDRGCHLLGEYWCGIARDKTDAIYLAVGTGIGAGIMCQGELLRGVGDISGAIGWMALKPPYHHKYDACGCFEYHASGDGLTRVARELMAGGEVSDHLAQLRDIRAENIFAAWEKGDVVAVKTIDQAVEMWGMAAANLVSLFNPQLLIFGGGVFGPGKKLIDRIYEEARKWAQPISINQVEFKASVLEGDAGLIGAGYLALNKLTSNRI